MLMLKRRRKQQKNLEFQQTLARFMVRHVHARRRIRLVDNCHVACVQPPLTGTVRNVEVAPRICINLLSYTLGQYFTECLLYHFFNRTPQHARHSKLFAAMLRIQTSCRDHGLDTAWDVRKALLLFHDWHGCQNPRRLTIAAQRHS